MFSEADLGLLQHPRWSALGQRNSFYIELRDHFQIWLLILSEFKRLN